jgi:DNA-binding NarL/FixJ family response regulator
VRDNRPSTPPPALGGGPFPVTERQAEILELAARGLSDKEIAHRLGVTHRTVRSHLERLYTTSGVRGRVAVVVAWVLSSDRREYRCGDRDSPGGRARWPAG